MAHTAFEDTYLTVLDVDGPDWADFLRYRMNNKIQERLTTEQTWLLTSKERFADLMVGNTIYKRETEEEQKAAMDRHVQQAKEDERRRIKGLKLSRKGLFKLFK